MRTRNIILMVVALMVVPLVVAACGGATEEAASPSPSPTMVLKDVVDTAVEAGGFTTLVTAVPPPDLRIHSGEGPRCSLRLMRPSRPSTRPSTRCSRTKGALTDVLTYHVVSGKVLATDLSDGMMRTP